MSGIEWTDRTWNPVTGCTKVSPGCAHCYAETMAVRTFGRLYPPVLIGADVTGLPVERPRQFTDVQCHEDRLDAPLRWRKPVRVFVNSMSDLFHEEVPDAFIDQVFAVMALCPQHTFQVLTKRPARMRDFVLSRNGHSSGVWFAAEKIKPSQPPQHWYHAPRTFAWPLPNVWLGPSIENAMAAERRFPIACEMGEAGWNVMVSMEPLLSAVTIPNRFLRLGQRAWVIIGGESGPGARPCDLAWIRSIVQQCQQPNVPVFVKQAGSTVRVGRDECLQFAMRGSWRSDGPGAAYGTAKPGDRKGGDPIEWPEDLRVREWPKAHA